MTLTTSSRASEAELLPCPFCGGSAKRITPMGFWCRALDGYTPDGVRYLCADISCQIAHYGDNAEEQALAAWNTRAALSAVPPQGQGQEGVSVKALEWSTLPYRKHKRTASSVFGEYSTFEAYTGSWMACFRGGLLETRKTEVEAQAAAQADFERRVRSCLTDTPKPGVSSDDLAVPVPSEFELGQRAMLNAILALNPEAAAEINRWADEPNDNPEGKIPFNLALWVHSVASQQGIAPLNEDDDALSGLSTPPAAAPAGKEAE